MQKVHNNLGHPRKDLFVRVLKAARTRPEVLRYVFSQCSCPDCEAQVRPAEGRKTAMPHTFQFNKIVAVDTVFVNVLGESIPTLNTICHGSNYQMMTRFDGTAKGAWSIFLQTWLRYFGAPDVVVSDGGGGILGRI